MVCFIQCWFYPVGHTAPCGARHIQYLISSVTASSSTPSVIPLHSCIGQLAFNSSWEIDLASYVDKYDGANGKEGYVFLTTQGQNACKLCDTNTGSIILCSGHTETSCVHPMLRVVICWHTNNVSFVCSTLPTYSMCLYCQATRTTDWLSVCKQ